MAGVRPRDIAPLGGRVRVLVLGAGGMFGHRASLVLRDKGHDVWGTVRSSGDRLTRLDVLSGNRCIEGLDVTVLDSVRATFDRVRPDIIVNAVGVVKQKDEARQAVPSITINALLPHQLADLADQVHARLIHISTDCVFSGRKGDYTEGDAPDPADLYGRSKLLGEVDRAPHLTLRTSIIGWELQQPGHGLLEWFASQRGRRIRGFRRAIYTGLTTTALAQVVHTAALSPSLTGLHQVSTAKIDKHTLLTLLRAELGWHDIEIEPDTDFSCDRSLRCDRFVDAARWQPPSWSEMITALATEWPSYENWRRQG